MPKVTVLMSVYNREQLVGEAIESILLQTFSDFEFIIINDGSTDRTRQVVLSFNDPRITLIDNDNNLGIPRSLNKGLSAAQGDFIARLDSDDIAEPERLAKQVAFLEANPNIALVGSWYREIDEQGNFLGQCTLPCDCNQLRWGLLFYTPFLNSSVTFRRNEVLQKIGLYNEEFPYSQDHELWVRISKIFSARNLDEYLVKYRVHPASVTLFHETRQYELLLRSCETYMATLLNSDPESISLRKDTFRMMQSLLDFSTYQDWEKIELEGLEKAILFVFKLSEAFCNFYRLTDSERKIHQANLKFKLSDKLIHLASFHACENRHLARKLLSEAYFINRSCLLSKNYQKALLKSIAGFPALKRVKNFSSIR